MLQDVNSKVIGSMIALRRKNSGLTQEEFVRKLGWNLQFFKEIEKGKKISAYDMQRIVDVLRELGQVFDNPELE